MKQVFNHPKRNKYGNDKVIIDGITFDSKLEGRRYLFLRDQEKKGIITDLKCHPTYELLPKQTRKEIVHLKTKDKEVEKFLFHPIVFTPDFEYKYNGEVRTEDVKGSKLIVAPDVPLRIKLLYFEYKILCKLVFKATTPIE